jgi:HAD-superfamily hydrolase, subfamily IIB
MERKIFFFDIDGTLLDCEHGLVKMQDKVYDALLELKQNGHLLCFSTGRCYAYLTPQLKSLAPDGMILSNGANVIYRGQTLHEFYFPQAEVDEIVEYCKQNDIEYVIEGKEQFVSLKRFEQMNAFFELFEISKDNMLEEMTTDFKTYKMAVIPHNHQEADTIYQRYHQHYQMMRHQDDSFDIYPLHISKGKALRHILQEVHLSLEDCIAFGDGFNDLEILEVVGLGIAMGNAQKSVKDKAKDVCLSVQENGVAKKLVELGYIKGEN